MAERRGMVADGSAFWFILPCLTILAFTSFYPAVFGLGVSLTNWNWGTQLDFVGLDNYRFIFTSDPVRDRMVALTRSMSADTSVVSPSIDGVEWLSNGTTTAKEGLRFRGRGRIETLRLTGKSAVRQTNVGLRIGRINDRRRDGS